MMSCERTAPKALSVCFVLLLAGELEAQTFTTLHSFDASLAANPTGIALSSNALYGTSNGSFSYGGSAIFRLNTDGTGFSNVYTFSPLFAYTNTDGAFPPGAVIASSNRLYGTTSKGGSFAHGTVFAVDSDGIGFANLHAFSAFNPAASINVDGANPPGGLILSDTTLYGTTQDGGAFGAGTVFSVDTEGTGFAVLHDFKGGNDGDTPLAGLAISGDTLYGTTSRGGSSGNGTVFALRTNGTGFTNLHSFSALSSAFTNSDGAWPYSGLTIAGTRLYGTTTAGGSWVNGTLFALNTDGTGFTILHSFTAKNPTNADGAMPVGGLSVSRDMLYGTANTGGNWNEGTVFAVKTDGTAFTTLYSFSAAYGPLGSVTNTDGGNPQSSLVLAGNTLYGTAKAGGIWGYGTVFGLSFSPQLSIVPSGSNIVLSWPINYAGLDYSGYTLQSTMNLAAQIWTTNLPAPVVAYGQNTVTVPTSGVQQFFRLSP